MSGEAHAEERRVVVRRDAVGDPDAVRPESIRGADQRAGGGELQPLVPGQRPAEDGPAAGLVPPGDLRPDGRVLEATGGGQAEVHRDPPFPATQEPRVRPGDRIIPLSTRHVSNYVQIVCLCFLSTPRNK